MNVATETFYRPVSVVVFVFIPDPYNSVNRQWITALGAIEGNEPSLTAAATGTQVDVTLESDTESGVSFRLVENAVLKSKFYKPVTCRSKQKRSL